MATCRLGVPMLKTDPDRLARGSSVMDLTGRMQYAPTDPCHTPSLQILQIVQHKWAYCIRPFTLRGAKDGGGSSQ